MLTAQAAFDCCDVRTAAQLRRWAAKVHITQGFSYCEATMKSDYWHVYYAQNVVEYSEKLCEEFEIRSTGVNIHVDVYSNPKPNAPVVIFNHGVAGYCRLFVQLAILLYECGYTVVLPDQRGQGLSGGRRGQRWGARHHGRRANPTERQRCRANGASTLLARLEASAYPVRGCWRTAYMRREGRVGHKLPLRRLETAAEP